jgi:hypothetical protein
MRYFLEKEKRATVNDQLSTKLLSAHQDSLNYEFVDVAACMVLRS